MKDAHIVDEARLGIMLNELSRGMARRSVPLGHYPDMSWPSAIDTPDRTSSGRSASGKKLYSFAFDDVPVISKAQGWL